MKQADVQFTAPAAGIPPTASHAAPQRLRELLDRPASEWLAVGYRAYPKDRRLSQALEPSADSSKGLADAMRYRRRAAHDFERATDTVRAALFLAAADAAEYVIFTLVGVPAWMSA